MSLSIKMYQKIDEIYRAHSIQNAQRLGGEVHRKVVLVNRRAAAFTIEINKKERMARLLFSRKSIMLFM